LYFDETDHTGHTFGPLSNENRIMVQRWTPCRCFVKN
jgi:hypothetical protein